MAVFRVLGNDDLVPQAEYWRRRTELVSAEPAAQSMDLVAAEVAPEPIGYGKPLTIMIRDVYTGEYPHKGLFGGDGDVAVVSGVKNFDTFNASTRALNFLANDQQSHSHLRRAPAFSQGSALVAYSPGIMTDSLTVSFELAVATFPEEFVHSLSTAFSTLAGIPLLLPYAGYLLGAGTLFKIAGNAGHALFDGVKFSVTGSIDFAVAGSAPTSAGFLILAGSNFDTTGFQYRDSVGLIDASGNKYSGDNPYVVISVDGRPRDDLKTFTPTAASSAILQQFFQIQEGSQIAIESVVQGLQLASDLKYRQLTLSLKAKLGTETDPAKKQLIQSQLDAALNNIGSDALKPA
jgi:hypothetical protein